MRRWLAALTLGGLCSAGAMAQTPGASSPPPGIEPSAPDFVGAKLELKPPGFGEVRHYFDVLQTLKIPEEARWATPEAWTQGEVQLVWHSLGRWWIGGTGVADAGYAVRVAGHDAYWALDDDRIAQLKADKVLPEIMPAGGMSLTNRLLRGYSLYALAGVVVLILAAGAILSLGKSKKRRAS